MGIAKICPSSKLSLQVKAPGEAAAVPDRAPRMCCGVVGTLCSPSCRIPAPPAAQHGIPRGDEGWKCAAGNPKSQHSPSVPEVFSFGDHRAPVFPHPQQHWLFSLLPALLCAAQLAPAPSCKGCRAPFLPPDAFPKAPAAHRGLHLPGCCRGRGASSPTGPPNRPRAPAASISIAVKAGLWEFCCIFFPSPLSLSLSPSGLFLSFAGAREFS